MCVCYKGPAVGTKKQRTVSSTQSRTRMRYFPWGSTQRNTESAATPSPTYFLEDTGVDSTDEDDDNNVTVLEADDNDPIIDGLLQLNQPKQISNARFDGTLLVKSRSAPGHERYAKTFYGYRRQMEISFVGRFQENINPRKLIMGCEVAEPGQIPCARGFFRSAVSTLLIKMMQIQMVMHYSFGRNANEKKAIAAKRAFFTFPFIMLGDHLSVSTKEGWEQEAGWCPVEDGDGLFSPSRATIARAERGKHARCRGRWGADDVVAMSFHTMYIDPYNWLAVNVPAFGSVSLGRLWGAQSNVRVVMYTQDKRNSHRKYFMNVELNRCAPLALNDDCEACEDDDDPASCAENQGQSHLSTSTSEEHLLCERFDSLKHR